MILKKIYLSLLLVVVSGTALSQTAEAELKVIQQRLDSIQSFNAQLNLELDIRFIEMPPKKVELYYQKDKPLEFESTDFVMLPKKGLDFTMQQLFEYPYIVVDRGHKEKNGEKYRQLSVIPQDRRADFAIATLLLDNKNRRIVQSEISTKKRGTYIIDMAYAGRDFPLPDSVSMKFEIQDMKLPIQYLSNKTDMEVDKKSIRKQGVDQGYIYLKLSDYKIEYR